MKKGFLFKSVRVVVVLTVSVALAFLLIKFRPRAEKKERVEAGRPVQVIETVARDIPMFVETYGTVAPREALTLVSEVQGQVAALHPDFKAGGFINKGDLLIEIDNRRYRLDVDLRVAGVRQAEAEIKRLKQEIENLKVSIRIAEHDLELARTEAKRLEKLAKRDMAAQSVLDRARRQQLTSQEKLQALKNQMALTFSAGEQLESGRQRAVALLDQARLDLEKTVVMAPYNAWVTEKKVEKGLYVNPRQPMGEIFRAGAFDITAQVPVADLQWIRNGDSRLSGLEAEVLFSGLSPPVVKTGKVARVQAALDAATRTLPLIIEVDTPGNARQAFSAFKNDRLKPGMFVTVRIKSDNVKRVHALSRHVIHDGDVVYLAKDGRLDIQKVDVLRRFKKTVFVAGGLKDGDLVITTPVNHAVSGMKITRVPNGPDQES